MPQFPQPHLLLKRGLSELDGLFGDFEAKLVADGGVPINWLENLVVVSTLDQKCKQNGCRKHNYIIGQQYACNVPVDWLKHLVESSPLTNEMRGKASDFSLKPQCEHSAFLTACA